MDTATVYESSVPVFRQCSSRAGWPRKLRVGFAAPPGVADLELHAGVDARVVIAERGAGDVDSVGREHERVRGAEKVLDADAALRAEVEDAGSAGDAVRDELVGREFVGGVNESA